MSKIRVVLIYEKMNQERWEKKQSKLIKVELFPLVKRVLLNYNCVCCSLATKPLELIKGGKGSFSKTFCEINIIIN